MLTGRAASNCSRASTIQYRARSEEKGAAAPRARPRGLVAASGVGVDMDAADAVNPACRAAADLLVLAIGGAALHCPRGLDAPCRAVNVHAHLPSNLARAPPETAREHRGHTRGFTAATFGGRAHHVRELDPCPKAARDQARGPMPSSGAGAGLPWSRRSRDHELQARAGLLHDALGRGLSYLAHTCGPESESVGVEVGVDACR